MRAAPALMMAAMLAITACSPQHERAKSAAVAPLTVEELAGIKHQIEENWDLGGLAYSPKLQNVVIELRVHLLPNGTVTKVEALNDQTGTPEIRKATESAIRATMISSPLKLPPGKPYPSIRLRFHPDRQVP